VSESSHEELIQQQEAEKVPAEGITIVGIGASAGGLEAFSELLRALPSNTGMAFVVVQHLDPHHESVLAELLAGRTEMSVTQVAVNTRVEPNHVYVIPPNKTMVLEKDVLTLSPRPASEFHKPIDSFLISLARQRGANSIGVILSGTASDGTLGLKAIKSAGGITFCQDASAKFDSMPRNAAAAGAVDFVLSPQRIRTTFAATASPSRRKDPRSRKSSLFSAPGLLSISPSTNSPPFNGGSSGVWLCAAPKNWTITIPSSRVNRSNSKACSKTS
jgi:two-component system CheB/CheR fusion protein